MLAGSHSSVLGCRSIRTHLRRLYTAASPSQSLKDQIVNLERFSDSPETMLSLDTDISEHFTKNSFPRSLYPKLLSIVGLVDHPLPGIEARLDLLAREGILSSNPARSPTSVGLWVGPDGTDRPA